MRNFVGLEKKITIHVLLLILFWVQIANAQEWNDIIQVEEGAAFNVQPAPDYSQQQLRQPQKKPSIWRRLFSPFRKKANPPILKAKKVPRGKPRETQPLSEPLLRLGHQLDLNGMFVAPGFYLLRLNGAESSTPTLSVLERQRQIAVIPAVKTETAQQDSNAQLPPPPKDASKNVTIATAKTQLSEDGNFLFFVYETQEQKVVSAPIPIRR